MELIFEIGKLLLMVGVMWVVLAFWTLQCLWPINDKGTTKWQVIFYIVTIVPIMWGILHLFGV